MKGTSLLIVIILLLSMPIAFAGTAHSQSTIYIITPIDEEPTPTGIGGLYPPFPTGRAIVKQVDIKKFIEKTKVAAKTFRGRLKQEQRQLFMIWILLGIIYYGTNNAEKKGKARYVLQYSIYLSIILWMVSLI